MTAYDLHPKTRRVSVTTVKVGDIIMESHEHPARVIRITGKLRLSLWCRYVWSPPTDHDWLLGSYSLRARIDKAVQH